MTRYERWIPFVALVKRESLIHLRRRSSGVSLMLMVGMAMVIVWVGTDGGPGMMRSTSTLLAAALYLLYFVSLLHVTSLAALGIIEERDRNTLEQLYLCFLTPGAIVTAKAVSAVSFFLLMCVGVLPVFGVVFFYVGVDIFQFFGGMAVVTAATLAHAGIGLAVSARSVHPIRAIVESILHVGLWSAGIAYVLCMMPFSLVSPFAVLGMVFFPRPAMEASLIVSVGLQLAVCFIALTKAKSNLEKHLRAEHPLMVGASPSTPPHAFHAPIPMRWIEDHENPIAVKAHTTSRRSRQTLHEALHSPASLPSTLFVFFVLAMLLVSIIAPRDSEGAPISMVFMLAGVATAISAPFAVAIGIARERNASTFPLLTTTLLTPWEIVWGHVWPVLRRHMGTYLLYSVVGAAIVALCTFNLDIEHPWHFLKFALGLVQIPVLCMLGTLAGMLASSTPRAVGFTVMLGLLYAGLSSLLTSVLGFIDPLVGRELTAQSLDLLVAPSLRLIRDAHPWTCAVNIVYQLLLFGILLLLATRMFAQLQRDGSRLERFTNTVLNSREF